MVSFKGLKVLKQSAYLEKKSDFLNDNDLVQLENYFEEIPPVINRTGWYLLDDKCWFEVRGRAFVSNKVDFLWGLRYLNVSEMDISVVRKLEEIDRISTGILTSKQLRLVYEYNMYLRNRHQERLSRRRIKEMKSRVLVKMKEKINDSTIPSNHRC